MTKTVEGKKGKDTQLKEGGIIAHIKRNNDGSCAPPDLLIDHLSRTGELAASFADKFGSAQWGRVAGLAHDAGKGRPIWQQYLRGKSGCDEEAHLEGKPGKERHAIYGAKLLEETFKNKGRFLSYCVSGHHTGLPDWSAADEGMKSLKYQLQSVTGLDEIDQQVVSLTRLASLPEAPWKFGRGIDMSLWIRMLYSSLVDADFLDTERYMDPSNSSLRGDYPSISVLLTQFDKNMIEFEERSKKSEINSIRQNVRLRCVEMSRGKPGIYSLSVPTGGGKTLSGFAFALNHSVFQKMDRVIYVLPYTSIIEQNADVLRRILGENYKNSVVEHHSNLSGDNLTSQTRLACENWDAPIIVTTMVQFLESFFSSAPSRTRKLHNIVNSVVVLDEAQLLPVEYLEPVLQTMQLLVDRYHVTLLISTATQPALGERTVDGNRFNGLKGVTEIMSNNLPELYKSLERVSVEFPSDLQIPSTWDSIADQLKELDQVLCVVSDRKSCRELYDLMPKGTYHLSGLMCGEHRINKIKHIKL
jgi:CRISPR-associated endonuclease/helicase Cas3